MLTDRIEAEITTVDLKQHLRHVELSHIMKALAYTSGNRAQACKYLCMSRTTLVMKLRGYKLLDRSRHYWETLVVS